MKTLNEWSKEIHDNAVKHGWWEDERSIGEIIALCHSELSEALEEARAGRPMIWNEGDKPEGIAVEMIDCVIRILDYLGKEGIDIDAAMKLKHEYNKSRQYKHGKIF